MMFSPWACLLRRLRPPMRVVPLPSKTNGGSSAITDGEPPLIGRGLKKKASPPMLLAEPGRTCIEVMPPAIELAKARSVVLKPSIERR